MDIEIYWLDNSNFSRANSFKFCPKIYQFRVYSPAKGVSMMVCFKQLSKMETQNYF